MFCSKCGKLLGDNALFCTYCGAAVANAGQPAPASTPVLETEQPAPVSAPVLKAEQPAPASTPVSAPVLEAEQPAPASTPVSTPVLEAEQPAPASTPVSAPVLEAEQPAPASTPVSAPILEAKQPAADGQDAHMSAEEIAYHEQAIMDLFTPQPPEEKYYTFKHIALCLAAVALMAIVAGVFAGLYFSAIA